MALDFSQAQPFSSYNPYTPDGAAPPPRPTIGQPPASQAAITQPPKTAVQTVQRPAGDLDSMIEEEGAGKYARTIRALYGQESGSDASAGTSVDGAKGGMQVLPGTFKQMMPNGDPNNPADLMRAGIRYAKMLGDKFGGDPARIAAGYFSGPGNVNPGEGQPYLADTKDGNGKSVSSYVQDIAAKAAPPKWSAITADPEFKKLDDAGKERIRQGYWQSVVLPDTPTDQIAEAKAYFDKATGPSLPSKIASSLGDLGTTFAKAAFDAATDTIRYLQGGYAADEIARKADQPTDRERRWLQSGDPIKVAAAEKMRQQREGVRDQWRAWAGAAHEQDASRTQYAQQVIGDPLKEQIAGSALPESVSVLSPSTWKMPENPTAMGFAGMAAQMFGSMTQLAMMPAQMGGGQKKAADSIVGMAPAQIEQMPAYQELRDKGLSDERARRDLAVSAAVLSGNRDALIAVAGMGAIGKTLSAVGGKWLTDKLAGVVGSKVAGSMTGQAVARGAAAGAEGATMMGGQVASENQAVNQTLGAEAIPIGQGTGNAVLMGAIPGVFMGGVKGAHDARAAKAPAAGAPLTPDEAGIATPGVGELPGADSLVPPNPVTRVSNWKVVEDGRQIPGPPGEPPAPPGDQPRLPAPEGPPPIMVDSQGNATTQPATHRAEGLSRQAEHDIAVAQARARLQAARAERANMGLTDDVLQAQTAREQSQEQSTAEGYDERRATPRTVGEPAGQPGAGQPAGLVADARDQGGTGAGAAGGQGDGRSAPVWRDDAQPAEIRDADEGGGTGDAGPAAAAGPLTSRLPASQTPPVAAPATRVQRVLKLPELADFQRAMPAVLKAVPSAKLDGNVLSVDSAEAPALHRFAINRLGRDLGSRDVLPVAPDPSAAAHIEPGQPPEVASPAVVSESLSKGAKASDRRPETLRQALFRQIDEAVGGAMADDHPDAEQHKAVAAEKPDLAALNRQGLTGATLARRIAGIEADIGARKAAVAQRIGFKTFDVPGDGAFRVLNTKERLRDFRNQVTKTPGFAARPRPVVPPELSGAQHGSPTTKDAINRMIDEGDPQAAVDYAAAKGVSASQALSGDHARLAKVADLKPTPSEEPAQPAPVESKAAGSQDAPQAKRPAPAVPAVPKPKPKPEPEPAAGTAPDRPARIGDAGEAMFQRSPDEAEMHALRALSENDELFSLPKSASKTVEGIAADTDPDIKVRRSDAGGQVFYRLTMPDGSFALLTVRKPNRYGPSVYGYERGTGLAEAFNLDRPLTDGGDKPLSHADKSELQRELRAEQDGRASSEEGDIPITERPGINADKLDPDTEDVYLDVSHMKSGQHGGKAYSIAATFAHNTGRVFIGDPAGLSDIAMRRRTEQMLSSALKFGTTDHLAPHSRQVEGDASIGVPPLRWDYSDTIGNIRSLVDVSLRSLENAFPDATKIDFDVHTGKFRDAETGRFVTPADLVGGRQHGGDPSGPGVRADREAASAGGRTVARAAVLRALLRETGREGEAGRGRVGLLENLVQSVASHPDATRGIFYDRSGRGDIGPGLTAADVRQSVDRLTQHWTNAPKIDVLDSIRDAPAAARRENERQLLSGATGSPSAFFLGGKVYLLADQLRGERAVAEAVLHESLGHYGLRGVFGEKLESLLNDLAVGRADLVGAKAKQYGWDWKDRESRLKAAEEVLAEMAQTRPELGWVKRAVAAIRSWLREHVPGLADLKLTDDEIVSKFILPARRFVENGAMPAKPASLDPANAVFARGTKVGDWWAKWKKAHLPEGSDNKVTRSPEFREWFGDSKVTDAEGRPLVVYHGTASDFSDFKGSRGGYYGPGIYFTHDPKVANHYAGFAAGEPDTLNGQNVMPVYLSLKNPFIHLIKWGWLPDWYKPPKGREDIDPQDLLSSPGLADALFPRAIAKKMIDKMYDNPEFGNELKDRLIELGHDGIIAVDDLGDGLGSSEYVAFYPEQIKSATGNRGSFETGNSDIRFQRVDDAEPTADKPADYTSGPLDWITRKGGGELARDWVTQPVMNRALAIGAKLVPEKVKAGMVSNWGLTPEYLDRKLARDVGMNRTLREVLRPLQQLSNMSRDESRVAYLWMQEKPDTALEKELLQRLDEGSRQRLADLKMTIDQLGRDAVDAGLLSRDAYERNKMAYLHRSYAVHEADMGARAGSRRAATIAGDTYKGRGILDPVSRDKIDPSAGEVKVGDKLLRVERRGKGLEVRFIRPDGDVPAGFTPEQVWDVRSAADGKKVDLWRDLTPEERQRLGEIDEVKFAAAKTVLSAARDVENAKFLSWVAGKYGRDGLPEGANEIKGSEGYWTFQSFGKNDWVHVPETKITGVDARRFGDLAGKLIPAAVWNDIRNHMAAPESELSKAYHDLTRLWKISKTALSPAVHMNNVMSNFIMADLADLGAHDVVRSLRTLIAAKRGDADAKAMLDRYLDSGAEHGSVAAQELHADFIEPMLDQIERDHASQIGSLRLAQIVSLAAHGKFGEAKSALKAKPLLAAAGLPVKATMHVYQAEDSVFRLAKFIKDVEHGADDLHAGKGAREAFLDYDINAPWIQTMRRSALPFIAFSYRAIPLMLKGLRDKPWKMAKYLGTMSALNAMTYALMGMTGEQGDRERRRNLPKELQGNAFGVFPNAMRMPWNDAHDSPVFLDVRRWIPAGDVYDLNGSHSAVPLPGWLSWGGPLAVAAELMTNQSSFTGKPIVKLDTDTPAELAAKVADHLFKWGAPNLPLPGPGYAVPGLDKGQLQTYSWQRIADAAGGRTDDFGRELSTPQAIASAFGIKAGSFPEDEARLHVSQDFSAKQRAISGDIATDTRQYARREIDRDELNRRMARSAGKLRKAGEEAQEALR